MVIDLSLDCFRPKIKLFLVYYVKAIDVKISQIQNELSVKPIAHSL